MDVVDFSAFCVFCEDENFKHTERGMGFEMRDGVNLDNIKSSQLLTNVNHKTN